MNKEDGSCEGWHGDEDWVDEVDIPAPRKMKQPKKENSYDDSSAVNTLRDTHTDDNNRRALRSLSHRLRQTT